MSARETKTWVVRDVIEVDVDQCFGGEKCLSLYTTDHANIVHLFLNESEVEKLVSALNEASQKAFKRGTP